MKRKLLIVSFATVALAWAFLSGDFGVSFEKNEGSTLKILSFEKNSEGIVAVQQSFRKVSHAMGRVSSDIFDCIGGQEMVRSYRDQPVLFGALFIFFGVSTCSIAFVVNLIRSDGRF